MFFLSVNLRTNLLIGPGGLPCGGKNSLLDFTSSRGDPTPPSWPLFILRTDQAGFSFEPTSDQPQARLIAHNTGSGAGSTEGRKITVEARNGPLRAEKAVRASQTRLAVLKARNTPFLHLANRAESSPTRGIVRRRFRRKGSRIRAGRRNRGEGGSGGRVC